MARFWLQKDRPSRFLLSFFLGFNLKSHKCYNTATANQAFVDGQEERQCRRYIAHLPPTYTAFLDEPDAKAKIAYKKNRK